MKLTLVGGTFDSGTGKTSGVIDKIGNALREDSRVREVTVYNGGTMETLRALHDDNKMSDADVIFWFANVPNEFEKYRDIKKKYPKTLLVTSKRNHGEYEFSYLINHALGLKANLVMEFSKGETGHFQTRVFDPLGTVWVDTTYNLEKAVQGLVSRLNYLRNVRRQGTVRDTGERVSVDETDFVGEVKRLSDTFHSLIHPAEGVTRYLGNASFRCRHGFPSFRGEEGTIYVTRRNIDKRNLGMDGFVQVYRGDGGEVRYRGDHKPSVDTPIQLRLYETYPEVNYMVHSHVYIQGAPFTEVAVPCGGLEEVDEILNVYPDATTTNVAINLIGHGSLVMASTVEDVRELTQHYIARPIPEVLRP